MSSARGPCRRRAAATAAKTSRVRSVGARTSSACRRTSSFARWKPKSSTRRSSAASRPAATRRAAVRLEAAADHAEVGEQLVGARGSSSSSSRAPHERELAPVRLERVPVADLGRVAAAARARRARSTRRARGETGTSERLDAIAVASARTSCAVAARARARASAVERRGDRRRRRPPGCRRGRRRSRCRTRTAAARPGSGARYAASSSSAASSRLSSKNQRPWRISSITRGRSPRTSSVCQRIVISSARRVLDRLALARRQHRVVERGRAARRCGRAPAAACAASPRSGAR